MTDQTHAEWLAALKAGDAVIVNRWTNDDRSAVVDHATAHRIVVGGTHFNRSNGRERGSTSWTRGALHQPTPERLRGIKAKEAASYLSNVQWWTLSHELVIATAEAVQSAREAVKK